MTTVIMGPYSIRRETFTYSDKAEPPELRGTQGESWKVLDDADGGRWVGTQRSEADAVAYVEQLRRDSALIAVLLATGHAVMVRRGVLDRFRGVDADGNQVYAMETDGPLAGELYAATPCCQTTATGTESGIACRSCYRPVSSYCGGSATVAVGLAPPRAARGATS